MGRESLNFRYLKPRTNPWFAILVSAGVHVGLAAALVIGSLAGAKSDPLRDTAIITRLLRKGEEKPKNWLPDKKLASQPPADNAVPLSSTTDKGKPSDKSTAKVDYSKQMKNALASLQKDGQPSKEKPAGSKDGVEEGDSDVAEKGNAYYTEVYKKVKSAYSVPELISERERLFLTATVVITLERNGTVRALTFEKSSGNRLFDSAIEGAIRKAAPFPVPPKELADKYAKEGIGIIFRAAKM